MAADSKIKLLRLAHVYYKHKNIEDAQKFLLDFGFLETKRIGDKIYYRGYGTEPFVYVAEKGDQDEFGGAGLVVESLSDLELATKLIPSASEIYELDAPGGGKCVTIKDPVDGWPMHLVYGQTPVEWAKEYGYLNFNFPAKKTRTPGEFQRFEKGPATVHKIGHFGMCVTNFEKAYKFYTSTFNFKASDLQHDGNGKYITAFMHIDLGETYTDHHTFFIFEGPKSHVHHSSYEVHDFDTEVLGHDWLRHKGYKNCWGVGRHVMGSQIFDYWYDTSGFILEHYVDGDQVNKHSETKISQASLDGLYVWGPDLPDGFLE
ncbi:Glyoxalase/Bleomycin resistance protein/Dihydroxybiphenyl dioxygenase [Lepidopterella palustris CBS 459.81]|uniref:Glyoxalase/Bleomycin resistance protein/Dihydroxybiphenyl dioxygenase n=1 Tax=Lepidopterella palustris CBS 459.81 TaxID=1314670 RepID=A0A8E2E9J6_9PEZI|nr:Glyoxalase/Bleomycin resistance protein/Dihydroxybiphenyl dioxygenase [Lepidopterella palustris CBS 459.81]